MKTTVILVPVFNEEENIDLFCKQILRINLADNSQIEVLFVDDGSDDKTWDLIKKSNHKNEIFNGLKLVKNFGKDTSIKVGLNYIKDKNYDNLIIMDGDMQHPISSIDDLIKKSNGKFIVQGLRSKTNSSIYRKIFNQFFYFFVNSLSDTKIKNNSTEFCLIPKKYIKFISSELEFDGNIKITLSRLLNKKYNLFDSPEREKGESKFSLKKLIFLGIELVIKKASTPLKFIIILITFLMLIIFLIITYYMNYETGNKLFFYILILNTSIMVFTLIYLFYISMRIIYLPKYNYDYSSIIEEKII